MEWTIRRKDQIKACREAWGVTGKEAGKMLDEKMVGFTFVFSLEKSAPDVVAVEYLGTPTNEAIKADPYKEITAIECIKAL